MKKFTYILLALCIVFSIVSCSNGNASSQNSDSIYTSSQTTSGKTTSSESTIVTNSSDTTSPKKDNQGENTSLISANTSTTKETSSNSSKINSDTALNTNVTSKNTYKQPTDNDRNITVGNDGIVSITIPKWFLLKMDPNYNYRLTDKEINTYKFISVAKNADASATYKIGYNDYHGFLLMSKSSVNSVVYKYKHNIWFSETNVDAGYHNIKIYTKYESLKDFDDDFGFYIAKTGLQTTFYQYIHYNYSVGTTITVYNKENVLLQTYNFPELF